MRICIYGAGAIGGYMGACLARAGYEVSLVARGPHMQAIQANGLTLKMAGESLTQKITCTDDPAELGPQDYVIVTLKAHSVPAVVNQLPSLFHAETAVVMAVNGVPWWYFYDLDGPYRGRQLESVDPGGRQWAVIEPRRAIGCVVYPACEVAEPGVIEHIEGNRFSIGEPRGEKTERLTVLAEALRKAGLKAPIRPRIRDEIWVKLWGNLSFNPISALTGATLEQICTDQQTRALARAMMVEAQTIGERLGVRFPVDVDRRIAGAEAVGAHKTSMLQDLEKGRAMEIDALVGAVAELGRLTEVPTPNIDTILALVQQKGRLAGCYQ
jgi:2-dehydropantoate 2-reductase